ncbi:MAG: hypothetical protein H7233_14580 [Pseudorhodobacter sp.]|nr:hypothetical protein [Frankiaceae bacterium]
MAYYERRWPQWQARSPTSTRFDALPALPTPIAAFVVARYRAGVSASRLSAQPADDWFLAARVAAHM